MSDSVTPWIAMHQASLSLTIPQSLPKVTSVASVIPSSHPSLWCPLLLLPSIFPSIRDFSNKQYVCIRWPKYWSFGLSISPSNKYSDLIFLKIDCFDLLAVQRTFRGLLQHHSLKASVLGALPSLWSTSHNYVAAGKTTACTMWTFVSQVMSLLFNTLSKFVIAFLRRSNHLLISWQQSPSAVILEPKKRKSHYFHFFPFYLPWSNRPDAMILLLLLLFAIFSFKSALSLSSFALIRRSLVPLHFLPSEWYHQHIWGCWCFSGISYFQLVTHPVRHFSWCTQHIG